MREGRAESVYHARPLYRREYDRLVELGLFADERVELLDGRLYAMMPQGPAHSTTTARLAARLIRALGDRAVVFTHSPLAMGDASEPEPDIAVVPPGDYLDELPRRAWLVIEISDSSIHKDRQLKAPIYAAAGVPDYWIVDLPGEAVEVRRRPVGGRYTRVSRHGRGEVLAPLRLGGLRIAVDDILPARRKPRKH